MRELSQNSTLVVNSLKHFLHSNFDSINQLLRNANLPEDCIQQYCLEKTYFYYARDQTGTVVEDFAVVSPNYVSRPTNLPEVRNKYSDEQHKVDI